MLCANFFTTGWKPYDHRKQAEGSDPFIFDACQPWEINYLISAINRLYPRYTDTIIFQTVRNVSYHMPPPRPRQLFVQQVVEELMRRAPCLASAE